MVKTIYYLSLYLLFTGMINSCSADPPMEQAEPDAYQVLPQPVSVSPQPGYFTLNTETKIVLSPKTEKLQTVGRYLAGIIQPSTGFAMEMTSEETPANAIIFQLDDSLRNAEGYELSITPDQVVVRARQAEGAFYAVQTLRQLLPPEIESKKLIGNMQWRLPAAEIKDEPRYPYRGMHLDVGRHFFPVDFIKKYIDLMAMHKLNRFHWHLTEDQGWRIEIKRYPKLQEIAAYRDETLVGRKGEGDPEYDGERYGGFYTQDEVKEVVRYAQSRFVEVIPEIEMPGHSQAVLAAYPELACTEGPFKTATTWGVFEDIYCPKEETFEFLENVIAEIIPLFPSEYIHIGGDEAPKKRWEESEFVQDLMKEKGLKDEHEVQSYFIQRMEKFINARGKKIIGWDEILEGGLAPNATVMSWRGTEGGIEAARQGHDVIMTPTSHMYLDYYQADPENEPLAIGGYLPLEKVYRFEPTPDELSAEESRHILGAQGNVWTEYLKTPAQVEYMAYPRAVAIAEVVWSPKSSRDFEDFKVRLENHFNRLDILDVNYSDHMEGMEAETVE